MGLYLYKYETEEEHDFHGQRDEATAKASNANDEQDPWSKAANENRAKKNWATIKKAPIAQVRLSDIEADKLGIVGWAKIAEPTTQGCGGGIRMGRRLGRNRSDASKSDDNTTKAAAGAMRRTEQQRRRGGRT